jgi:AAA family ATP:ADP antiporter
MSESPKKLTQLERFLSAFTKVRPGEGRSVMVYFMYALLMMFSYYILKTIREPLLLANASAEIKSYAYAVTALLLLFIIPLYGLVFRHSSKRQLTRYVTLFFLVNLLLFYLAGRAGLDIGFAYYVWVGIFSVMITAQFWAFAADSYNVKSGQRLFPLIMVGATLGSLAAPALSGMLFQHVGAWPLLLSAMALLALTLPCVSWGRAVIPPGSGRSQSRSGKQHNSGVFGGISFVLSDRYLFLLAMLILLLNWVNTTGEYILSELVVRHADALVALDAGLVKADIIAGFYGNFFFAVNTVTLLIQVFLVARIIRWIGVKGAVLVLPVVVLIGYGLVVFIPIFSIIRIVKIMENSTDYSLMNTTRHALYLPLSAAKTYEGKTTIDAFFWRFGDLLQAGSIYAGLHWFNFELEHFAVVNMGLAMIWLWVAWRISRYYTGKERLVRENLPPRLERRMEDRLVLPNVPFEFSLPGDTFVDPDEGDVLTFSAHQADSSWLPAWLDFDSETLCFGGIPPAKVGPCTRLILRATDFDGAWVEGELLLLHRETAGDSRDQV